MLQAHRDKINNILIPEISKLIIGQKEVIRYLTICLLAGGPKLKSHILFEGAPGLGKTELAKALATVVGGTCARVQGTPDLLASDITGIQIYSSKTNEFEPRLGPVFANILLVDEINRMQPKTQSALLEAMQEGHVTIGLTTHFLPEPFMVLATQNPGDYEGVFPLTEVQIDRFMMKLNFDYPTLEEEIIITRQVNDNNCSLAQKVLEMSEILEIRQLVRQKILFADRIRNYLVQIVQATRPEQTFIDEVKDRVKKGASPRAANAIEAASRVNAFLEGRSEVIPDDVDWVTPAILRHRIIPNYENYGTADITIGDSNSWADALTRRIIEKVRENYARR